MIKNKLSFKRFCLLALLFCLGLLTFNFQRNNFLATNRLRPTIDSDKFSLDVPPGWKKLTRQLQNFKATVFMAPKADGFFPNINVILDSGHGVSLDEYIAHNRESMKESGMQLDSVHDFEANGNIGKWFNVAYTYQSHSLALKSYIFMQNNVAYINLYVFRYPKKHLYHHF